MICPSVVKLSRKKKIAYGISIEKDEGKRSPEKEVYSRRKF
jgi:hypothetical protein